MSTQYTIIATVIIGLILVAGCAVTEPTTTPVPPTATAMPLPTDTSAPTDTPVPLNLSIEVPQGNPATLDGILSPGEWDGARQETFPDGNELLLMHDGVHLYLGIRSDVLGLGSICVDWGEQVAVLHSSASLGTAVYEKTGEGWERTRNFDWTYSDISHLEREGWLASEMDMGVSDEMEYQIAMPKGVIRLAVAYLERPDYDSAVVWPTNLADDCQKIGLLQGYAPWGPQFSPETWMTVTASTATVVLPTAPPDTKQALLVIYEQFEEREYGEPRTILEEKGVVVTVASSSLDVVTGHQGTEVQPDVLLSDAHAAAYDAVVFIGGYRYEREDPEALRIAQEAVAEGKVLAAICVAPITLAKAGVLEGKRATSSLSPSAIEAEGGVYTGAAVERDGLIITANGPGASQQFGEAIAAALKEPTTPPPASPEEARDVRITIVYDNNTYDPRLKAEWGFAALVEYGDHTLLFDTGGDGAILLENMALLEIDPQTIETVVLSHIHGDHTGGLQSLLDTGVQPTVYVPAAFPSSFKDDVRARTELVEVTEPLEILPGVHSTGEMGSDIVEQGLVVETPQGIVVITGCAHPFIVRMVRRAREVVNSEVALVVGGFHLEGSSPGRIDQIIADFRELGVKQVSPTHCTGEKPIAIFTEAYSDDYVQGGVGRVIVVGVEMSTP